MEVRAVGIIHSPFQEISGTPIQPTYAGDTEGVVEVFPEFESALSDLIGYERIWLLYWFDRAGPMRLHVVPFRDTTERGLFSTRAPCRPNPIGLSCVRLLSVADCFVRVAGIDVLDKTPLLDIKPYIPDFDGYPECRAGWHAASASARKQADDRFRP
ncbi:MAG: tRNA (N6-threonylcarbamoyladenosine(37)-N6)-methyltransferase TrmO [Candidatus Zixiibacteriota bacterium]